MKAENFYKIENLKVNESSFAAYDIERVRLLPLLFQTGYLTIKEKETHRFTLDYPNREVRESMQQYILGDLMFEDPAFTTNSILNIQDALFANNVPQFIDAVKELFARIPYQIFISNKEAYYHSLLYICFHFLGNYTETEVSTNMGRIDTVIHTPGDIYIIEFKLEEPASVALDQIRNKRYFERYISSRKTIHLLGISFSSHEKSVAGWKEERILPE
ncbi:MAG: PD-(D/E)XK nuclease domain-containing protein [Bacteroidia bacterium]